VQDASNAWLVRAFVRLGCDVLPGARRRNAHAAVWS
jgi:hypothetical protein